MSNNHDVTVGMKTLPNYFQHVDKPVYSEMEVTDLMGLYDKSLHPAASEIRNFLESIHTFLCATTLGYFKEVRDQYRTEKDLLVILNDITKVLSTSLKVDNDAQSVVNDAHNYAIHCVKHRLDELKKVNDRIYDVYMNQKNSLKPFLTSL